MSTVEALGVLRRKAPPFLSTGDAAAILGHSLSSTTRILADLADAGVIRRIRNGHWALDPGVTPLAYAGWVVAPMPSYVSLYTALYHHGLIQQIPVTVYVVSLAKTGSVETSLGTYSVHQISPTLFGGFDERGGVRMATPEKAVFDTLYMGRARSGKFAGMTEVELPDGFDRDKLASYAARIEDQGARRRVTAAIESFLSELG